MAWRTSDIVLNLYDIVPAATFLVALVFASWSLDLIGQDTSTLKLYGHSAMGLEFSAYGNERRFSKLIKTWP